MFHHLFFVDDSILFGTTTDEECRQFRRILNVYEQASGQKVNFQKNSVVFSNNVSEERQDEMATILEVQCVKKHDRYIGLPMRVGRSKRTIFGYDKEKLTNKLVDWKAKILTVADEEISMSLYAIIKLLPITKRTL